MWCVRILRFIECATPRDVYSATRVKKPIPFVMRTITQEQTLGGSKGQFVSLIWTKKRKASRTKDFEKIVISFFLKQLLIGRNII